MERKGIEGVKRRSDDALAVVSFLIAAAAAGLSFLWMLKYTTLSESDILGTMVVVYFSVAVGCMGYAERRRERKKRDADAREVLQLVRIVNRKAEIVLRSGRAILRPEDRREIEELRKSAEKMRVMEWGLRHGK